MSELTNIHARAVKDLTTPTELPADPNALDQVKLVAGNFPAEYAGNEAMTVGMIKELAAQGREEEIEAVNLRIATEENRAKKVEAALINNKANKATTLSGYGITDAYTQGEIDSKVSSLESKKANKADVDTTLSNLSTTANKYYSTLAAANADIANIALNQSVTIGEEANSGLWYKATAGATSLTKSPYDPLTQSQKYTNSVLAEGYIKNYSTETTLKASVPPVLEMRARAEDTRKIWHWKRTSGEGVAPITGTWTDTGMSDLDIAKALVSDAQTAITHLNLAVQELALNSLDIKALEEFQAQTINHNVETLLAFNTLTTTLSEFSEVEKYFSEEEKLKRLEVTKILLNEFNDLKANGVVGNKQADVANIYTFPEPKSAVVINLETTLGIPEVKGDVRKGTVTLTIDGETITTPCTYEVQGSSSAFFPKKNMTFAFFDDEDLTVESQVKIGELLPHHELIYKANWIDHTHVRNIGANRIWKQMQESRKNVPIRDIDNTYVGKTGIDGVETGALGHVQGYSCLVKVNGNFYGIGSFNIGKKRQNYNLPKNKPEKIFLEINHWTPITVLDTENTGWNGSEIVEIKTPSSPTTVTMQYIQDLRDFAALPQAEFTAKIGEKLDKNNIIDYIIFTDFTCAVDLVANTTDEIKNGNLISWTGKKWFFMPYDLDTVFGLHYGGISIEYPPTSNAVDSPFWNKIKVAYAADLKARYVELRKEILTVNNVRKVIHDLSSKFTVEMYAAEFEKWTTLPSKEITSINQIQNWVAARLQYMDNKYNPTV